MRRYCVDRIASLRVATGFSGICTPTCALEALRISLSLLVGIPHNKLDSDALKFRYLCAVEQCPEAATELSCLPHKPHCLFGDFESFLTNEGRKQLTELGPAPTFEDLKLVLLDPKHVSLSAWCSHCRQRCKYKQADLAVAGSSCRDWSSLGSMKGEEGAGSIALLIWCNLALQLEHAIMVMENVSNFKHQILEDILGSKYSVQTCVVCGHRTFGNSIRRKRRYTVLSLKRLSLNVQRDLDCVRSQFARRCAYSFTDYFWSLNAEQQLELQWAASRTSSIARTQYSFSAFNPITVDYKDGDKTAFEISLTPCEAKHLASYRVLHGRGLMYSLIANPANAKGNHKIGQSSGLDATGQHCVSYCITKSGHLHFHDSLGRFATARELLSMQGFPTTSSLLGYMQALPGVDPRSLDLLPITSFNYGRLSRGCAKARSRRSQSEQAGNAMDMSTVGATTTSNYYW